MNVKQPNQSENLTQEQPASVAATPTTEDAQTNAAIPRSVSGALDEKSWAMGAHLSVLLGYLVPFGNIIAPLVIWQMKKDQSEFITEHAKESLNFQISMTIYMAVAALLMLIFIGIIAMFGLAIMDIIFVVMASVAANKGEGYRYPLSIRFVK